ncbi:MAG: twin-arginine translocation signal domain-containing protein, partial [Planctomycetaceae bacterium]|nr:twin-arginine translocation signal domain-containing protein [Planctomycetaceae bacterium]
MRQRNRLQPGHGFDFESRRSFLKNAGSGFGSLALTGLLSEQGILKSAGAEEDGLEARQPHFVPKAKSIIWLFMPG